MLDMKHPPERRKAISAFEFAFTLFGLVLGLALTVVLAGFVGVLKARTSQPGEQIAIRFGLLTPLLAAIVVTDLMSFWISAWYLRDSIVINQPVLLLGTVIISIYFVTASLIFPDQPTLWPDLDDWFDRHKGQIGIGVGIANVGFSLGPILAGSQTWRDVPIMQYVYVSLMLLLTMTRQRWQSGAVLIALALLLAWGLLGLPTI